MKNEKTPGDIPKCARGLKRVKKGPKWGSSQKKYFFQEKIPKYYLKTYKSILGLEKSFGRTYGLTDEHFEDIAQLEVENNGHIAQSY